VAKFPLLYFITKENFAQWGAGFASADASKIVINLVTCGL